MDRAKLLEALARNVDGFVERVDARYPGALTCHAGCSDCCLGGLSVTLTEAEAIEALLSTLPPEARERIAARADAATDERCAALEDDGRCGIYAARPLVCRSHGLPIRFDVDAPEGEATAGRRRLTVVDACPKNFVGCDLEALEPSCVLDQETLSRALGTLDAAGRPPEERGGRVELRALLGARPSATD